MNLIEALNWRYAVSKFSDSLLTDEDVEQLLEAVRLTPSSFGLQPYKIIVVDSLEQRRNLLPYSYGQTKVFECSHLVVLAARTNVGSHTVDRFIDKYVEVTGGNKEKLSQFSDQMKSTIEGMNDEEKLIWAHNQVYIALGNLLTSAAVIGIDACPMAGFDRQGFNDVLGLKQLNLDASVICPIGYRHSEDKYTNVPKVRYDHQELIIRL